jgi:AcrR family transcriptional regulator
MTSRNTRRNPKIPTARGTAPDPENGGLPSSRRERRRTETEQRLFESAMRLFAERGIANTTIEAITEAADVGKGTFFNYFPSKEHLILAFGEKQLGKLAAASWSFQAGTRIEQVLRPVVHRLIGEVQKSQTLARGLISTALGNDMLTQRVAEIFALERNYIAVLMEAGRRSGEIRSDISADELARLFQQFLFGTLMVWSVHTPADLDVWADQVLDVFWGGIKAQAKKPARKIGPALARKKPKSK